MAIQTDSKIGLAHAMGILSIRPVDLARMTGLSLSTICSAISGNGFMTNIYTACLIAEALGMEVSEISWPAGLSHIGRTPLTGRPCNVRPRIQEHYCPTHHLTLPLSGVCDLCA